jgi:hypothetical protein
MRIHTCLVERDTAKVISVAPPLEVSEHYVPTKIIVPLRVGGRFMRKRRLAIVIEMEELK